jgi:prolipoprotein diacylglyceryltransferase
MSVLKKSGYATWTYVAGYGFFRFITDFFRTDMPNIILGLKVTQILNLAMFILGLYFIIKKVKK